MTATYWFSTRSALLREDPAWEQVAPYLEPLHRLIARRYPYVKPHDRDDLVQELLIEIKSTLAARHDPGRGRFRSLLAAVVHRRVVDLLRRKRLAELPPDAEAEVPEAFATLDLEASLQHAFAACRDRFTQGPDQDHDVLYALVDRVVHGKSNVEIARENDVSPHRVARLLRRARSALCQALVARELDLLPDDPRLELASEALALALRDPRLGERSADRLEPTLSEAVRDLGAQLRSSSRGLGDADALRRGLAVVLEVA